MSEEIDASPADYAQPSNVARIERTAKLAKETVLNASQHTVTTIQNLLNEMQKQVDSVVNEANTFCADVTRIGAEHADRIEKALLDIAKTAAMLGEERRRYLDANTSVAPKSKNGSTPDPRAAEIAATFIAGDPGVLRGTVVAANEQT